MEILLRHAHSPLAVVNAGVQSYNLQQSIERLADDYPGCVFRGVAGDFTADLDRLGPGTDRLFVFFAGTVGNLDPDARRRFLRALAGAMSPGEALLVGVDLVKDPAELEAAYNDPQGVTAAINRNMLEVVNRRFGADFAPDGFAHRAFFDPAAAWIEMRLRALRPMTVRVRALDFTLALAAGDEFRTEISCKFTAASVRAAAEGAGLELARLFAEPNFILGG